MLKKYRKALLACALGALGFAAPQAEALVYSVTNVQNAGGNLGLSPAKTYTHKLDFPGDGLSTAINGVQFSAVGAGAGVDPISGNGYNLGMAAPASNSSPSSSILTDFIHNAAQPANAVETLTFSNLTPGATYDARLYYRSFGSRPNTVTVNTGGGTFNAGTLDQATPFNENYFSIKYRAEGTTATFTFQQQVANDSWHQYAVSNEVAAAPLIGLFNTGVDNSFTPLADNAIDPHWTLSGVGAASGAGPSAIVATSTGGFPIPPWLGDNASSAWITPSENTQGPGATNGTAIYLYSTQFTATQHGTYTITGEAAADNALASLAVDGIAGTFVPGGFTAFSPFSWTGELGVGVHTLTIGVQNGAGEANPNGPTGLRVQFAAALFTPVPEPATASIMMLSMAGLAFRFRRQRA